jgi:hypothetical protein
VKVARSVLRGGGDRKESFLPDTDEGSNDAGGKGWTVRSFCRQNIEGTGGNGLWKKRKQK